MNQLRNLAEWRAWLASMDERTWSEFIQNHDHLFSDLKKAWEDFLSERQALKPEMKNIFNYSSETIVSHVPMQESCLTDTHLQINDVQFPILNLPPLACLNESEHHQEEEKDPIGEAYDNIVSYKNNDVHCEVSPSELAVIVAEPEPKIEVPAVEVVVEADAPILPTTEADNINTPAPSTATMNTQKLPPFPNARQGEWYEVSLPPDIQNVTFQPHDCGLVWDKAHCKISGTPTQHGDIEVQYHWQNGNDITLHRQTLYINPDPKSLWRNIPSDETVRFYKPDNESRMLSTPYGQLITARVRGRSHAHQGIPCDDDFNIEYHSESHIHILAVSDGAGSAEYSRLGSQEAVYAVVNTVENLLKSQEPNFSIQADMNIENYGKLLINLSTQAAYNAYLAQYEVAKREQLPLKSLSSTLLFALSMPVAQDEWLTVAYAIGDGALVAWHPEQNTVELLAQADNGHYSGETRFLSAQEATIENISKRIRTHRSEQVPILFLMTDGVSDPKFETDAKLAQSSSWQLFWEEIQPILQQEHPEQALEQWLDFWSPGNHDDRTLAVFLPNRYANRIEIEPVVETELPS